MGCILFFFSILATKNSIQTLFSQFFTTSSGFDPSFRPAASFFQTWSQFHAYFLPKTYFQLCSNLIPIHATLSKQNLNFILTALIWTLVATFPSASSQFGPKLIIHKSQLHPNFLGTRSQICPNFILTSSQLHAIIFAGNFIPTSCRYHTNLTPSSHYLPPIAVVTQSKGSPICMQLTSKSISTSALRPPIFPKSSDSEPHPNTVSIFLPTSS